MLPVIILIVTIGGTLGGTEECEFDKVYSKCLELSGAENDIILTSLPDKDELLRKCPNAFDYYKCFAEKMDDCTEDTNDIYDSYVKHFYELTKEVCDEDSSLHQGYTSNVECYRTLTDEVQSCKTKAKAVYETNYSLFGHSQPENTNAEWLSIETMCLVESVFVACIAEKVHTACGQEAYSTMVEMALRSQYLRQYCAPRNKQILVDSLLPRLDLEEDKKNLYNYIFNNIKK